MTEHQIDRRVNRQVSTWARIDDISRVPDDKLPTDPIRQSAFDALEARGRALE